MWLSPYLAFMLPSMPLYMLVMLLRLDQMEPDLHMPLFMLSLPSLSVLLKLMVVHLGLYLEMELEAMQLNLLARDLDLSLMV